MNDYEQNMVRNLRDMLSDVSTDDYTDFDYLRWLQGHNFDMAVIVSKLRHHFAVIRSYNFDNYDVEKAKIMETYWPWGLMKSTGKGHYYPNIETHGTWDGEGVVKCVSKVDISLHRMFKAEQSLKAMRNHESESGHQSGLIFIVDGEGAYITTKKISLLTGPYKNLLNFLLQHYVEMIEKFIVINPPLIVWALYSMFKPIIPERTRQKFIVLGSNWKTDILQYCDPDTLPVYYGGTVLGENNDPKCASQIVYTTKVPEALYWSPSDKDPKPEDLTVLTVTAGTTSIVTVEVTKADSTLEWYYTTDSDWGFGIFFTESESESELEKMEMVFPQFEHFNGPTNVPEEGKIKCKKSGFYKIWFNNYFSWFTKLHVSYKITVIS